MRASVPSAASEPRGASSIRRAFGGSRGPSLLISIALLVSMAGSGRAQTIDTTLWVANGNVNAVARSGGTVYIGGNFSLVGPATGSAVPISPSTGSPQGLPNVVGSVFAVAPDGSGGWYIGGNFTYVAGVARSNLARIKSDYSLDAWNPSPNGIVNALAVSGTTVYVGGTFNTIGGQSRPRIAAVSATTGNATSWNPNSNSSVNALAVSGVTIYAGGDFTNIGGQLRNRIAALDTTGSATVWNPNANNSVYTLAVSGPNVYAGGAFSTIGGATRNRIAAMNVTGTGTAIGWNPNANSTVRTLVVNGSIAYAGGEFTSIGGQSRNFIAQVSSSGSGAATSWNPRADLYVYSLAVGPSVIYAGGAFDSVGGAVRNYIGALDSTTGAATSWNPSAIGNVNALGVSGTTVFAGGNFNSIGAQQRIRLAALDAATGAATSWNPTADGLVNALVVSDTSVYVGGDFSHVGGQTRSRIAELKTTTGSATPWNPNANDVVSTLAVDGATVYAGGFFTSIGGQPRNRIAALMRFSTGAVTAWNPNANGAVRTLVVNGSTVYAGGDFNTMHGVSRVFVAALDDSGIPTAWNPSASGGGVYALVLSGGIVYAGGDFNFIGGLGRNRVAALDAVTGAATSWDPNANSHVDALAPSGSTVFIGGAFTSVGGQAHNNIAAVSATTGAVTTWNPGLIATSSVYSLAASAGKIYWGGSFTSVGATPQCFVAAAGDLIITDLAPASAGNGGEVTVTAVGSGIQPGGTIKLTHVSQSDLPGADVSIASDGGSISASFDLIGATTGPWNLVVTNPGGTSATLANAFTVEAGEAPQLRVDLVGRDSIRANYPTAFDLVINNVGNVDATAVPVWVTGIPLDATVSFGFPLSYPHRDAGEPDWSQDSTSFTGSSGRYLALVIPRIPPGTISKRINLSVPPTVASFQIHAALAPPWGSDPAFRSCLTGAGVITNGACMDAQLAAVDDSLAIGVGIEAMSGIGVWSKIGWQCEGATTLAAAQNKAHAILDYLKQPIELGAASAGCGDALLPRWQDALNVVTASAVDPNDKLGARKRLSIGQSLPYTVLFENLSNAGLPARHVRVVDNLDLSKLDASTIRLGAIIIGNVVVTPTDPRATNFSPADVPLGPGMSVRVRVTVDRGFGLMTWDFQSIDPATGQEPSDPLAGFLPPNQAPPAGQGSVQFTVTPVALLTDGASIQNGAAITFDGQTTNTVPWGTTVDNSAPTSHVFLPNSVVDSTHFTVKWEALNTPPDLKDFTIFVSENGAPFHPWIENTITTTAQYPVGGAFRYAFYSVSRDTCGNVEANPTVGQDTMYVLATPPGAAPLRLSLEGARPNPTSSAMRVWFTLPSREPATLELIDVMGRRLFRRDVGSLGPGRHSMTLSASPPLRAGLYFLRLAQRGEVRQARAVVIR